MQQIDWSPVARKIEQMLKKKIKDEGLVKTGTLLDSIKAIPTGKGGFDVVAEDYYVYLDDEHKLTESVFESDEYINFYTDFLTNYIESKI